MKTAAIHYPLSSNDLNDLCTLEQGLLAALPVMEDDSPSDLRAAVSELRLVITELMRILEGVIDSQGSD